MEHQSLPIELAVGAVRVSTIRQAAQGDSKEQQKEQIIRRVTQLSSIKGTDIHLEKWFELSESASGILELQPINRVIEYCKTHKVKYLVIKSVDRMTRAGPVIYGLLKQELAKYGVTIVDSYGVISDSKTNTLAHLGMEYKWSVYSPSEISEFLEAERSKGEVRDILSRMIGAAIHYTRQGYHARTASMGYTTERVETPIGKRLVLVPHPIESKWFIRMFENRIRGLSDQENVDDVNALGFKTRIKKRHDKETRAVIANIGDKQLTLKQLQRYLVSPIYAGVDTGRWAGGAVKKVREGLVTINMFNEANKGKIMISEENGEIKIYKGNIPSWLKRKNKENPNFPYKFILCPKCRGHLRGSNSRGKLGKYYGGYHCSKGHYFRVPMEEMNKTIENFVKRVKFTKENWIRFSNVFLEEWEKRIKQIDNDKINYSKRLVEIDAQKKAIKETLKQVSSSVTLQMLEEDIEKLEAERVGIENLQKQKDKEEVNMQVVLDTVENFMEHLEEILLEEPKHKNKQAMFMLLFEEFPTYEELISGTPKIAPLFELKPFLDDPDFPIGDATGSRTPLGRVKICRPSR